MAWADAPETLTVGAVRYSKCTDCYARVDSTDNVSIVDADVAGAPENSLICYRERESMVPVCASGRLYVSFEEGSQISARASDLEAAGFQIDSIPGYALHTAWVSRPDGDVGAALAGIAQLETVPGVVRIEPQLLGVRAHRDS
ncbi:MAG: hypothetical protein O7F71_21580 [Gammaproteobacteria bacterium]|nr:hypothetical protein [Gammaproteobacteria bacterium]